MNQCQKLSGRMLAVGCAALVATTGTGAYSIDRGLVTVPGTFESPWTPTTNLNVGSFNSASLTLLGGGQLFVQGSRPIVLGVFAGSNGVVTVTGAGSYLQQIGSSQFLVGSRGSGTLAIENGGAVNVTTISVGDQVGATGNVVVDGASSVLTVGGWLSLGDNGGTGSLSIRNGGTVSSANGGTFNGTVDVGGAGSSWTTRYLSMTGSGATSGRGALTIHDGGTVNLTLGEVSLGDVDTVQSLNIGAAAGQPAAAAGTLNAPAVNMLQGTLVFNHLDTDYIFAPVLRGTGTVEVLAGTTDLTGDNAAFSGSVALRGGTLQVGHANALGSGDLEISGGAFGSRVAGLSVANRLLVDGDFVLATPGITLTGDVVLARTARIDATVDGSRSTFTGVLRGAGGVVFDADAVAGSSTFVLSGSQSNTYAGPTTVQGRAVLALDRAGATAIPGDLRIAGQGSVELRADEQIADAAHVTVDSAGRPGSAGLLMTRANGVETIGSLDGGGTVQLGSGTLRVGSGSFAGRLSGGAGSRLEKIGDGTLTLSGPNDHAGTTTVSAGTLRAGATNTLSAASAHGVAGGATLDLAGFSQTVASLANAGTVSLVGTAPGRTLTVTGAYVGSGNAVLALGTRLGAGGISDRLVLDGPSANAAGRTTVQITNLGGLGGATTGNGIEVVTASNGATTTAQTTRDAFVLAGGSAGGVTAKPQTGIAAPHVDAGAFAYRLYAGDANGAGENWYLRTDAATGPAYRNEVPLLAALPSQLRQADLAMLGGRHRRVGDDDPRADDASPADRRAWARVLHADIAVRQQGTVSPTSKGDVHGFQTGADLFAASAWRVGMYVGQLEGKVGVAGAADSATGVVGANDLRSRFAGGYATYSGSSGFYADAVLQAASHSYTAKPLGNAWFTRKGASVSASLELGQPFDIGAGWQVEPQLQLVHRRGKLDDVEIAGARVEQHPDGGWLARAGVRATGSVATAAGTLRPYARLDLYRSSSGSDIARFVGPAASTDIASRTGYGAVEVAGGFTLALRPGVALYGEAARLSSLGGEARVRSTVQGSLGLRARF